MNAILDLPRRGRPRGHRRVPRHRHAGAVRRRPACRTSCGRHSTAGCSARALLEIGYFSLPVVALTAVFTGMVLALQSYTGFSRFSAESAVANLVVLSITRELGPVLAGLMVAGPRRCRDGGRDSAPCASPTRSTR